MASLMRPCATCGQVDDHPRCVVEYTDGSPTQLFHHDCHTNCAACTWLVAHTGDLTGDAWRDQITAVHAELDDDELATPPADRLVVESHADGGS
jgi:hypothetical protein